MRGWAGRDGCAEHNAARNDLPPRTAQKRSTPDVAPTQKAPALAYTNGPHAHESAQAPTTRTSPSCAVLATRRPSRENTLPRPKPRAPEALGLSMAYSSQSSTRSGR